MLTKGAKIVFILLLQGVQKHGSIIFDDIDQLVVHVTSQVKIIAIVHTLIFVKMPRNAIIHNIFFRISHQKSGQCDRMNRKEPVIE